MSFRDIYSGWHGSVHDAQVFINSRFYKKCINGEMLLFLAIFCLSLSSFPPKSQLISLFLHHTNNSQDQKAYPLTYYL